MEPERAQNFNDRLNQWIAGQGFWFQLKYSMSGRSGLAGSGGYHLLRLGSRALIFFLIIGVAGAVYLLKLPNTEGFAKKVEAGISEALKVDEIVLDRFKREQGKMHIVRLAGLGREDAFFTDFEAKNVVCSMDLLDSVRSPWRTGGIALSDLVINLRAGAEDKKSAATLGESLFKQRPDVVINAIDVMKASVSWGFSASAMGRIEGSQMKVRRRGDGWWIQFREGTFSQNWLKKLEIEELELVCSPSGISIEKGIFRKGEGSVTISEMTIKGAERPEVDGMVEFRNLPLDGILPESSTHLFEGIVSGHLKLSGSTNSSEGILMEGKITLGEGDAVVLREGIPLLRALRMADSFNNYRRVRFQKGSFEIKTGNGRLDVTHVDLKAGDLMTLEGGISARPPTRNEIVEGVESPPADSPLVMESAVSKPDAWQGSGLNQAAKKKQDQEVTAGLKGRQERYLARLEEREIQWFKSLGSMETQRYEGEFVVTVREDAFDQTPLLKSTYPVDESTGRIPIVVPIAGTLELVTFSQAESIHSKAKR